MNLTTHAQTRMQQRAISPVFIDWLEQFGSVEPQEGAELIYFSQRSLKKLACYTGGFSNKIDKLKNVYLIRGGNGRIITAGYRDESIKRK
jgi:hypothetical protein